MGSSRPSPRPVPPVRPSSGGRFRSIIEVDEVSMLALLLVVLLSTASFPANWAAKCCGGVGTGGALESTSNDCRGLDERALVAYVVTLNRDAGCTQGSFVLAGVAVAACVCGGRPASAAG